MFGVVFILFFGSAVICGIIDFCKDRYTAKIQEKQLYLQQLEETETQRKKINAELEFLTARIGMLEDLQLEYETELRNGSGNYKTNLSRLISLDNQIHATQQKIDKLLNKLKSL